MSTNNTTSLYRGTQVVWYLFDAIEILLGLRFIMKLLGANPAAGFTDFIYSLSGVFLAPFQAVFGAPRVGGSVFEWSTLLAMIVYWIIAWGIVRMITMGKPVSPPEAERKLDQQDTNP